MLALLKTMGKWGAEIAVIVSIPMASAKHDMKEHLENVAIERTSLLKRMDFQQEILIQQNKKIDFLYRRELEKAREEKQK